MTPPSPTDSMAGFRRSPTVPLMARPPSVLDEHAVLVQCLGRLQRRMDQLRADHEREIGSLNAELLRLRAQRVLAHTRACWGVGADVGAQSRTGPDARPAATAARVPRPPQGPALAAAQAVICQTGCAGHAHPWRESDGQCRLSGLACDATRVRSDR